MYTIGIHLLLFRLCTYIYIDIYAYVRSVLCLHAYF